MYHTIINLTNFPIAKDLQLAGVRPVHKNNFLAIKEAVTFSELPNQQDIKKRVKKLVEICEQSTDFYIMSLQPISDAIKSAQKAISDNIENSAVVRESLNCAAMISCPPWLEIELVKQLKKSGIKPVFNFIKTEINAGVKTYNHVGFVEV